MPVPPQLEQVTRPLPPQLLHFPILLNPFPEPLQAEHTTLPVP
jgi:hypothetical protein